MKKITGNTDTVTSEGVVNPDVVFNNDALVVDYLKSLLASTPSTTLDSSEAHVVQLALEAGWKRAAASDTVFDTAIYFETERSKVETELLRTENKDLKFKSELAKIDVQVLRSENENFKFEVARLKAQLDESKCSLNALKAENADLTSKLELLQNPPEADTINTLEAASADQADPEPDIDEAPDKEPGSDSEPVGAYVSVEKDLDEPELSPIVPQDSITCEVSEEILPNPEIAARNHLIAEESWSGVAPDTAFMSRALVVNENVHQKPDQEKVIISRNRVVSDMSIQSAKPASKIIKQHVVKNDLNHQADRVVKTISPDPVQPAAVSLEAERKQHAVSQQFVAAPEAKQENEPAANKEMLHSDGTEEIDVKPAPAPKVVVRRNVKNYEDLQSEADSTGAAKEGHTVIL